MKQLNSLSPVFLVTLLLSLVVGCGPEFTGSGDGGEAGVGLAPMAGAAGSDDEPQAGTGGSSAGTGGTTPRGGAAGTGGASAGTGGTEPRGGAAGAGGDASAGVGGTEPQAGASGAGTGGSGGGSAGAPEPSCEPSEATLEIPNQFQLHGYSYNDGMHCAECPPGGCGTCRIETKRIEVFDDNSKRVTVTATCDTAVEIGLCGELAPCSFEGQLFYFTMMIETESHPDTNGYIAYVTENGSNSANTGSSLHCGGYGYGDGNSIAVAWRDAFQEMFDGSTLRCE
jgi:hypothetical protein